jgi:guanylate kinase
MIIKKDTDMQKKFILLSGPSGIGKGPLAKTLFIYMSSNKKKIIKHVLYTDREKRSGEVNGETYHFVEKGSLQKRKSRDFMVFGVHEQYQGIDFVTLRNELDNNDLVFLEIFHERIPDIITEAYKAFPDVSVKNVFLTPLSNEDFKKLGYGKNRKQKAIAIQAVMQTKLINRNTETPEKILKRSKSAYREIKKYTGNPKTDRKTILVNHYGEDVASLWQKLQDYVAVRGGLEKALDDPELKYLAETFALFLEKIGCRILFSSFSVVSLLLSLA